MGKKNPKQNLQKVLKKKSNVDLELLLYFK